VSEEEEIHGNYSSYHQYNVKYKNCISPHFDYLKTLRARLAARTPSKKPLAKISTLWNLLLLINSRTINSTIAQATKTPTT
jgi:hypothetical protein